MASETTERQIRVIKNGKLEVSRTYELRGVTPEMLSWYRLARTKEWYKMWHPDHIDYKLLYKPAEGSIGAVYSETQKVGGRVYEMKKTILAQTDEISEIILKFPLFSIWGRLVCENTPTGTVRHSTQVYGSDNPVWGRAWNFVLRKFVLPRFLEDFSRHQDEEMVNTMDFLPKLYAEAAGKAGEKA